MSLVASLRMRAVAMTHQGKVRDQNEDCVGIAGWVRSEPMRSPIMIECTLDEPRLCIVADGLGGHSGGEFASMLVVRELSETLAELASDAEIATALDRVNRRVFDVMEASPNLAGMGTTVVGLVTLDDRVCLFNIGDSRGYIQSGKYLRLLSTDDTAGSAVTDPGERTGQRGHRITQCIGGLSAYSAVMPHIALAPLRAGDRFLLCSDGLTDMLDQDGIEDRLSTDPFETVEQLVSAALLAGGEDNISVVVVDFLATNALPV